MLRFVIQIDANRLFTVFNCNSWAIQNLAVIHNLLNHYETKWNESLKGGCSCKMSLPLFNTPDGPFCFLLETTFQFTIYKRRISKWKLTVFQATSHHKNHNKSFDNSLLLIVKVERENIKMMYSHLASIWEADWVFQVVTSRSQRLWIW